MIFKKRLNNNVVIAIDGTDEKILTGKGLGFQMQAGNEVDETKIEKIFALADKKANQKLLELCETIPMEHVELAEEIVNYAKIHVNEAMNENAILALCDHIYMAVERKKQGVDVKNVLLWDIQKFYRDEYEVGRYAVKAVQERFHVALSEDEAGFIALHIVNAQLNLQTKTVKEITVLMQEIERIVRIDFAIDINTDSIYYDRFISHLKFFAERVFSHKTFTGQEVDGLLYVIIQKYPKAYACVNKISAFLTKKYAYTLSEEEILYLSIHISRIVQVSTQKS